MYGGAKGGGKSYFLCRWAFLWCHHLIDLFKLEIPEKHPLPIGFIGRKRGVDFSKTTLETWKKAIPSHLYRIREQQKEIIIEDKVKIHFGGMDDENTVNKFNSAEYAFICLDQAEECTRTDLALLKGTLRLKYDNIEPKYKVLLTANPAPCFLRQDYIDSPSKDGSMVFIQALPHDNPYLPDGYIDTLTQAFKHRPELVRAYVHGDWDQLEGSDLLIKHSWVTKCVNNDNRQNNNRRVTVCDIARLGDDETVIYNMVDSRIVDEMIYGAKNTMISCGHIIEMANRNDSDLIAIDADGMGGSVYDALQKQLSELGSKKSLLEIRSGKKAEKEDAYVNSRSEMWFHAAKMIAEQECSIPNDQVLIGQLSSVKYNPNGSRGRFQLEKKVEVKKRLDSSPDRADAFIYGLWATTKVPSKKYDFSRIDETPNMSRDGYGWSEREQFACQGGWRY